MIVILSDNFLNITGTEWNSEWEQLDSEPPGQCLINGRGSSYGCGGRNEWLNPAVHSPSLPSAFKTQRCASNFQMHFAQLIPNTLEILHGVQQTGNVILRVPLLHIAFPFWWNQLGILHLCKLQSHSLGLEGQASGPGDPC